MFFALIILSPRCFIDLSAPKLPRVNKDVAMEHAIRRSIESRRAYDQRRKALALGFVLALTIVISLLTLFIR